MAKKTEPTNLWSLSRRLTLKDKLIHGEIEHISELIGYAADTVRAVLNGDRDNDIILEAVKHYIHERELLDLETEGIYHRDLIQQEHEAA